MFLKIKFVLMYLGVHHIQYRVSNSAQGAQVEKNSCTGDLPLVLLEGPGVVQIDESFQHKPEMSFKN